MWWALITEDITSNNTSFNVRTFLNPSCLSSND
nr:MAG TPA: hypothetical protein [Caudoviricetes sp.]